MFDSLSQFAAEWILPLLFFWLVMCLFATNIQEWITTLLDFRGRTLEQSIRNMLGSKELTEKFYDHPLLQTVMFRMPPRKSLVTSLVTWLDRYFKKESKRHRPDYINSRLFAQVILDWALSMGKNKTTGTKPRGVAQLQKNIQAMRARHDQLADVLDALLLGSIEAKSNPGEVVSGFQTSLQEWFENAMEETTLYYKRRVQAMLLTVGFVLALYSNFDPITMTVQLWDSSQSPDGENAAPARLPIGWTVIRDFRSEFGGPVCYLFPSEGELFGIRLMNRNCLAPLWPSSESNLVIKLAGFLVGGLLISIGSQYVFDLWKNKIKT